MHCADIIFLHRTQHTDTSLCLLQDPEGNGLEDAVGSQPLKVFDTIEVCMTLEIHSDKFKEILAVTIFL